MATKQECTRCGKKHLSATVYLELDSRTGLYSEPGTVAADRNQGGFPFGRKCAAILLSQGKHQATVRR
jgi:hypothetical protein